MDIYCGQCGQKNESTSAFCKDCGNPLEKSVPQTTRIQSGQKKKRTWVSRTASIGASIVILFFFFPWASVSCSSSLSFISVPKVAASGYQIASGNYPAINNMQDLGSLLGGSGIDTSQISQLTNKVSTPLLWVVLLLGAIGLFSLTGSRTGGVIAISVGIIGVICLLVFGIKLNDINSQVLMYGFKVRADVGLTFEWIGFLSMIAIGFLSVNYDSPKEKVASP